MRSRLPGLLALTLAVCAYPQTTGAVASRNTDRAPPPSFMAESRPTLAPVGYVVFCMRNPQECRLSGRRGVTAAITARPLDLTAHRKQRLREINARINRSIRPRKDPVIGAFADQWTIAPRAGDCEDYALTKRAELMKHGFAASTLRVAVARAPGGEGHAVLIVRTSEGDLVLDNRHDRIVSWNKTDLGWVSIQSSANPRRWHAINGSPATMRLVKTQF